ncbi:TAXI family TRAP transporter solute-binding subunit [Alteribacillus bidgolensis]|uniref:TRAP transporter solute receptor, TAXI family n=1 Tax=Alteribacillus bidgolensis TaxID=930129 RepID=A0A1G8QU77_9BACI|nr:TAXI family TRAP transporter solute-binding subunit [Alteribacillus bidgolensis]SDJ08173.1 hypothetical protein SAMN05216352_12212 [Alteribacillus bidgolensis]
MKEKRLLFRLLFMIITAAAVLIVTSCGVKQIGVEQTEQPNNSSIDNLKEASASKSGDPNSLNMGAHQPGIAYHSAASGIASVVSEYSNTKLTVKPFSGPNAWMPLLNNGEIDLGILSYPDAGWALKGENGYPEKNSNLRILMNGNNIVTSGLTVRTGSGIKEVEDLEGKRVASDYSGNQILSNILKAQLASAGLTVDDVEKVPVTDVGSGLNALREKRVDAVFTGTPTVAAFTEMDTTTDIDALNWAGVSPDEIEHFPQDIVDEMNEFVPGVQPETFDGGILNSKKTLVSYPIVLGASAQLSEDAAYEVVKTLWNNYESLHSQFSWLETWEPEQMFNEDPPAPYHPGAVKFFKEQEVWTDKVEQRQKELLEKVE